MTNESETSKGSSDATTRRTSGRERTERFSPTGPVRATIATKSGDVDVRTVDGNELEVTLRASSSKYEHLLELATVHFDATNNVLEIESLPGVFSGSFRGVRDAAKSWFDFGGSDLDVVVVLPHDSSLDVKTMSGDASLHGELNDVDVASASGDVSALDSCRTLQVKTASGDVVTGQVLDVLKCHSASGDVRCRGAATKTDIASASGDVTLTGERPGSVVVKVVSGDVHISVARGLAVDVNGNTVSGDLGSNIDLGASGGDVSDDDVLFIKVNTVSGDIRVDKAA
ncbi:MAG TPA: DUF4097 family beta strand repeat-containing protein [Acidimicrobiales bacterium]|jgi:DUF4097 and DUF4098 domain-containing protein YvlB|nr:DUF4097 family beta strand repeat-containing protein [Acidimicrobiales bacterium]